MFNSVSRGRRPCQSYIPVRLFMGRTKSRQMEPGPSSPTNSSEYLTLSITLVRTINQTPIITSPLEFQSSKNSNYAILAYYHSAHSKCQSSWRHPTLGFPRRGKEFDGDHPKGWVGARPYTAIVLSEWIDTALHIWRRWLPHISSTSPPNVLEDIELGDCSKRDSLSTLFGYVWRPLYTFYF